MISFGSLIKNEVCCKVIREASKITFTLYLIHPAVLDVAPYFWRMISSSASSFFYALFLYIVSIIGSVAVYWVVKKIKFTSLKLF